MELLQLVVFSSKNTDKLDVVTNLRNVIYSEIPALHIG